MAWLSRRHDADKVAVALNAWLPKALEYGQAGFYFEEGGCIGMALALHDAFRKAGKQVPLARLIDSNHVGVVVDGRFFDWQGFSASAWVLLGEKQFDLLSAEWGHDDQSIESDKMWAAELIDAAIELHEESES